MVDADSPPASLPSKAANASSKSPVENALQVEDRNQHFEALRAPGVERQNGRAEPNAPTTESIPVAHPRLAHSHRSNAGHDLALGQMGMS
jgi:hypothetical protein